MLRENYDEVASKFGSSEYFSKSWFDGVQFAHLEVRRKMKEAFLSLDVQLSPPAKPNTINGKSLVNQIAPLVGDFLHENGLDSDALYYRELPDGPKTSKAVLYFYRNDPQKRVTLEKLFSLLGVERSLVDKNEKNCPMTLDTSCQGFLRLGQYAVDRSSCLNDIKNHHRFNIALLENGFVLTLSHNSINLFRAIGWWNSYSGTVNFFNVYSKTLSMGSCFKVMESAASIFLGKEKLSVLHDHLTIDKKFHKDTIHYNKESGLTFYRGQIPQKQEIKL